MGARPDQILGGLQWSVGRGEPPVKERWPGLVSGLDQPNGFGTDQVGGVALFFERLTVSMPVQPAPEDMVVLADTAGKVAVSLLEAPPTRKQIGVRVAEMPFPRH